MKTVELKRELSPTCGDLTSGLQPEPLASGPPESALYKDKDSAENSPNAESEVAEEPDSASGSAEATRRGAVILEVLAGVRGPGEAAQTLGISAAHYYLLERKAVQGLVRACEPQPKGRVVRGPTVEQQLVALQRQLEEAQREALRQAALVRASQRAMGLPETAQAASAEPSAARSGRVSKATGSRGKAAAPKPGGRVRRARRPTVRALRAAQKLRGAPRPAANGETAGAQSQSAGSGSEPTG